MIEILIVVACTVPALLFAVLARRQADEDCRVWLATVKPLPELLRKGSRYQ